MQIIKIDPDDLPNPSKDFQIHFNSYLELCKFTKEEQLGILFYLGAILPGKLNDISSDDTEFSKYLQVLSLYSKSTGDFSDYGDLNDAIFSSWIYNTNLAISKICADETSLDENLRILPFGNVIVGKAEPKNHFLEKYNTDSFSLNVIQNLNDDIFSETGKHLLERGYSNTRAYEAGFAYRMLKSSMDIKGTHYLLSRINSFLSPLFKAIFYSPYLYVLNNYAFKSNHLFSQILNSFVGGENSRLMPVAKPIHLYHQFLFYKENSSEFRNEWFFIHDKEEGSAFSIFFNALNIRNTNLIENAEIVKQSGEVFNPKLINAKIGYNDF
jgi:hypothetical protein